MAIRTVRKLVGATDHNLRSPNVSTTNMNANLNEHLLIVDWKDCGDAPFSSLLKNLGNITTPLKLIDHNSYAYIM